jgi:tetratricopeptide (TPR) repeat protein
MDCDMSDRMLQLQKMLEREPDDTFLLYGLALEHKKAKELDQALDYLARVIAHDPGYCYAYHQRGLIHEMRGDLPAARLAYKDGVIAAIEKGDAHAQGEISAALEMCGE